MKEIDWSKAPEGAQGYMPKSIIWAEGWWKDICGKRFFCHAGQDEWKETHANAFGLHGFVYRPDYAQGAAWSGDGLPPVGTRVVIHDDGSLIYGHGESGEVIAHVEDTAVVRMSYGLGCFTAECLRTPEQIAAEEREKAIQELIKVTCINHGEAARIHDAGYRKVTP
ncbi:hypothetical protein [Stutzerimonas nitrititolerans]|uniref:hypothetical protein n=1 Tax=Stutzerimonas nitrititolerans TaxID=2482751 RepID=UPI0028A8BCF7|nr:hypothetical protein [Stutzerimonas nitrititolerans]